LGLQYISESYKTLAKLQVLHLDFLRCQKITDSGMQSVIEGLQGFTSLSQVVLGFYDCKKVSSSAIDDLRNTLKIIVPSRNYEVKIKEKKEKKKKKK